MKKTLKTVLFLAALLWMAAGNPVVSQAGSTEGISAPVADVVLSFVTAGKLNETMVKEGDLVEKGQLLAALEDKPERLEIQQLKAQAEDRTRIAAAQAELAQKRIDLKKLLSAKKRGAASDWEIEHARLGVRITELSLKAAVLENEQFQRRYDQATSQHERMRIVSPISGRVEKINIQPGEAAKMLGPVIQVVKIDPLWIEVQVPLTDARQMSIGKRVWVTFPGSDPGDAPNGEIIHISSVADAASDTLQCRIEVGNPELRPAGERVIVQFEKPATEIDGQNPEEISRNVSQDKEKIALRGNNPKAAARQ
jgi:RND family efflux transporter MFP subunit